MSGGDRPEGMIAGDLNKDGNLDLVTANSRSDDVSVLLGDGSGGFASAVGFSAGDGPVDVVTADFDADGDLDLAVVNLGSDDVSVLLGDGSGSFADAVSYNAGIMPESIVVLDLNTDGNLDLAVGTSSSHNMSMLLGDGTGSFARSALDVKNEFGGAVAGDFDNDGNLDLAIAVQFYGVILLNSKKYKRHFEFGYDDLFYHTRRHISDLVAGDFDGDGNLDLAGVASNSVVILFGGAGFGFRDTHTSHFYEDCLHSCYRENIAYGDFNNDGILNTASTLQHYSAEGGGRPGMVYLGGGLDAKAFSYHELPTLMVPGDFDGDGNLDLAIAGSRPNITLFFGDGTGSLYKGSEIAVGSSESTMVSGDFDGDGGFDLAVAAGSNVSIFFHDGSRSLGPEISIPLGIGAKSMGAWDFDGDGDLDLAVANVISQDVSILLGDGSGSFGVAAHYPFENYWSLHARDFDGDGDLDLVSFDSVLFGDGSGCFGGIAKFYGIQTE